MSKVIIENTSYFLGKYIFSDLLGPIMDTYLNHYYREFLLKSQVPGQLTADFITLDYRHTRSPRIQEDFIEFDIVGDFLLRGESCENFTPEKVNFMEGKLS